MAKRTATTNPKAAIGYLRVSTDEQHLGPEAQRASIEAWAVRKGVEVVAWFTDHGVSGAAALDKRPGLMGALDALRAHGAGVLVAAKRDRIARDVVLAAMVDKLAQGEGASVATADGAGEGEGPEAALMRGIVDVFAQYERALIRARTKAALGAKKAKGERVGNIAYGWRLSADGVTLEEHPEEQRNIATVRALRAAGETFEAIAARAADVGLVSRNGRPLPVSALWRISRAA